MPSHSPQGHNKKSAQKVRHEGLPRSGSETCQILGYVDSIRNNSPSNQNLPVKLIPIETVCDMLGLKRSATLGMVAKGILPRPLKFGASRRASARWLEHEIVDFILKKAAARNPNVGSRIDVEGEQ